MAKRAKKRKKYTAKTKGRMFIIFIFFCSVIFTLGYTLLHNLKQINDLKIEMKELNEENDTLADEEKTILADIKRLSDSTYIARYAREKYFYSKEGEIILRINE